VPGRFSLKSTFAEIARARHIAEVLVRNGLGFFAEAVGLTRFIPPWRARRVRADARTNALSVPSRVRHTLEQLGPTYIKLGQILSTRPDVLPADYIVELSKLLDAAPPVVFEAIAAAIERELGAPIAQCYASLDPEPIASASIGQVHRATLPDGTPVVVKVQRPDIEHIVQADLNLLSAQARFLAARSETLKGYGLTDLVDEFAYALRDELDYTIEARNADRLRALLHDHQALIPGIHWELTTHRVITMDDLTGIKLSDIETLRASGYDLPSIAAQVVHLYLEMVFEHGMFHADPHPANILVHEQQIGLVDFGVVGYLTPRIKDDLGDLLFALVQQDADGMVRIIIRMGATEHTGQIEGLRREVRRLIVRYYNASLASLPMAEFLGEVMTLAFRYQVRLPTDLALLARTVVVLEGVARRLDPSFVLANHLEPFVARLVKERLSLRHNLQQAVNTLHELDQMLRVLPRRLDTLSEQAVHGDLALGIKVHRLDQALRKLDAIGNRLSFSVVVAALIIGSASILGAGERAARFVIPFTNFAVPIAQVGFLFAGLLGAWLLISIIRTRGL
jgi:ubiquinone biosynthesis protein